MLARQLSAGLGACLLTSAVAAQETSFARVVHCKNEAGYAEVYLPGSVVFGRGAEQVKLGGRTVDGYIAFDFTPVGKNKTLEAVRISASEKEGALVVAFPERASRSATIPRQGGAVRFPQRLAEEMTCGPLNTD
jgi:hypothetical protein